MLEKIKNVPLFIQGKYYLLLSKRQLILRENYISPIREKLTNHELSVFANNCVGGVLLHELGVRFNSPFVNLFVVPHDYIELISNPEYYFSQPLRFIEDKSVSYPVAMIDSIRINFVHYKSPEEAEAKWFERVKRINWENLFVIMTEQDGCKYDDLIRFDHLPYTNKIVFTKEQYSDIKCCRIAEGYEGKREVSMLLEFRDRYSIHRNYDFFDFVEWFNQNGHTA